MLLAENHIIVTGIIWFFWLVGRQLSHKLISTTRQKFEYSSVREKVYKKMMSIAFTVLAIIFTVSVWGIDRHQVVYFISSVLTVIGVAFVAQWSILSNVTASFIMFFSHPIKIGESITILEKDFEISGRIADIGAFFVTITNPAGESILVPSNLFLQKMTRRARTEEVTKQQEYAGLD